LRCDCVLPIGAPQPKKIYHRQLLRGKEFVQRFLSPLKKKTFNRHDDSSVHPGIIQALGKPFHKELLPEATAGPNPGFVPKRFVELY
jgi:hypothetical protein